MLRYACKSLKRLCVSRAIAGALLIGCNLKALNILVMDLSQAPLIPGFKLDWKPDLYRSRHGSQNNILFALKEI